MKCLRLRTILLAATLAASASLGALAVAAEPASAAIVRGCTSGFCIDVDTGSKNYSNHTQWVGWVYAYPGGNGFSRIEVWADGFYQAKPGNAGQWFYVGRWVRSGTYVCGAVTIAVNGSRKIPCIAIRV